MTKFKLYNQNVWGWTVGDRLGVIRNLIRRENPDICTFQEFNPVNVRGASVPLQTLLSDEYIEACSQSSPTTHLAIFYKASKFKEVDSGLHLFSGFNDSNSKGVMWAVLKEISSGNLYAVASTHFWWEFQKAEDDIQRVQNARDLKQVIDNVQTKYSIPFFIAGDLNSGHVAPQKADGYEEMLRLGLKDVRHIAKTSTDNFTLHEYPVMMENGTYAPAPMPKETIDYIFVTSDFVGEIEKFDVLVDNEALKSSDHCPLIAEYSI